MDSEKYFRFLLTDDDFSSTFVLIKQSKLMIEKSSQVQSKSRELQIGGIAADRFLMNGLMKVERKAFCRVMSNGLPPLSGIGVLCADLRACSWYMNLGGTAEV